MKLNPEPFKELLIKYKSSVPKTFSEEYEIRPSNRHFYNSPEEVREALGLKPWEEFKQDVINYWNEQAKCGRMTSQKAREAIASGARTGRTTRMLVDAVFNAQSSLVLISGCEPEYTRHLIKLAKEYCRELGIPVNNILYPLSQCHPDDAVVSFRDHYVRPVPPTIKLDFVQSKFLR